MKESRSEFSLSIVRIAVAQICQTVGYDAARTSALDTLSNITTRYLKAVAKSAADSANSCGRTHSNFFDIVVAFEDLLGSVQGFTGASSSTKIQSSIISSSLLKEIRKFVLYSDEIPFAQPLPRENYTRHPRIHRKEKVSYNDEINLGHVPRWLPELPAIEGIKDTKIEESLGWEFRVQNMVVVEGEGEGKRKEGEKAGKGLHYLPKKRRKVRFEMGLKGNTRGVLSRVGIGKRVLCHNLGAATGTSNEIEGNERKKKTMKMVFTPA